VIYTDTTMALSGINKTLLAKFGGECRCYISDPRVVRTAKEQGITRSMAAVDIAVKEEGKSCLSLATRQLRCFACWSMMSPSAVWLAYRSGCWCRRVERCLTQSKLPAIAALGRKGE
jgi:precorrin-8X/cobalt-precorrin-8 methylmutase